MQRSAAFSVVLARARVQVDACRVPPAGLFCCSLNTEPGKEGRVMTTTFFVHYRTRGPIPALQMRLQG